ncbi:hypothetical protein [Cyanobium sp. Lug-B]|uniref:hypothetical protein n=1 Tax=Cyanobium sp. Lug-B TaxID=2823716 RepID=UPI0020CEF21F|nr:hypothetical protein [Cyanobium sp. Lug-B]MCP9798354.1 hypothetical protein [Cyanobium sp. Lug-B]
MGSDRLFRAVDFMPPSDDEPIRSVIVEAAEAVVVAPVGCVHGVSNHGQEPLTFISVVSPADAGFEPMPDTMIPTSPLSS